jgi:hypothetical protein
MEWFPAVVRALLDADVRFVVIGVGGANFYATRGSQAFFTRDRDLFLPPDAGNELRAWSACENHGLELWCGDEPLGQPRDQWLAERIVERRMVVTATDRKERIVDLSLTMADLEFEEVWSEHRTFLSEGVSIPVARLTHIVESKRRAAREKDLNFLITHEQALRDLLRRDGEG